ncbi:phosphatase PAP2 family protein [Auraticoccus sp. F435]|uniref:Phosphatase PAP2 family protein n=1 Tax=Auraticoccus cholistanensis TaxID=2656650 RepID=A0A6A9UQJ1_9ACTN|nr:diacylglycerol kinase family protein [Auraticoccus cholistanensis]MVA74828.1 phosphatase PAP2 family protein [Auraticoccus cholistanensis]
MTPRRLPSTLSWVIALGTLLAFLTLSAVVASGALDGFDRATAAPPLVPGSPAEEIFSAVALLTMPVVVYTVVLGFGIWCARHRLRNLSVAVITAIPLAWLGNTAWKHLLERPRPPSPHDLISATGYSFPSGHATAVAVLVVTVSATLIHTRQARRVTASWRLLGTFLVLLVAVDRWIMSAHWVTDVLGGLLWGVTATSLTLLAARVRVIPPELDRLIRPPTESVTAPRRSCAVVYNPTKVTDWPSFRRRVGYELQRRGYDVLWLETTPADPGRAMTARAVREEVDLVLGAGGDGTIRVVCDGLAGTGIPFGVIPAGTGNLLAKNLGIPLDETTALRLALDGVDTPVDLVQLTVDGQPRGEHFTVMAGVGVDAVIMAATNPELKRAVGSAAYFVAAARHAAHPPVQATIRVDDGPVLRRRASVIVIGNVGFLQGGIPLIPDARANDGLLDLLVASPAGVRDWARLVTRVLTRAERDDAQLDRITGRRVTIRIERSEFYQMDGDTVGQCTTMVAEVNPGALLLRLPPNHRHGLVDEQAAVLRQAQTALPAARQRAGSRSRASQAAASA